MGHKCRTKRALDQFLAEVTPGHPHCKNPEASYALSPKTHQRNFAPDGSRCSLGQPPSSSSPSLSALHSLPSPFPSQGFLGLSPKDTPGPGNFASIFSSRKSNPKKTNLCCPQDLASSSVILKMWAPGQQHQDHRKFVENANSQAPPRPDASESLGGGDQNSVS